MQPLTRLLRIALAFLLLAPLAEGIALSGQNSLRAEISATTEPIEITFRTNFSSEIEGFAYVSIVPDPANPAYAKGWILSARLVNSEWHSGANDDVLWLGNISQNSTNQLDWQLRLPSIESGTTSASIILAIQPTGASGSGGSYNPSLRLQPKIIASEPASNVASNERGNSEILIATALLASLGFLAWSSRR